MRSEEGRRKRGGESRGEKGAREREAEGTQPLAPLGHLLV